MSNLTIDAGRVSVAGFFKIEAHQQDEEGNVIPESKRLLADWFPNLITNAGLDMLASSTNPSGMPGFASGCQVGSGSATPTVGDTALQARIAGTTRSQQPNNGGGPSSSSAPYFDSAIFTFSFGAGAAAGNLSEIGIGPDATGNLFSRSLIKDASGKPTTITVLPTELLTVTYQLRLYIDPTPVAGSFVLNSKKYTTSTSLVYHKAGSSVWVMDYFGSILGDGGAVGAQTYNGAFNGPLQEPSGPSGDSGGVPTAVIGGAGTGAPWVDVTYPFSVNQGNAEAPGVTAIAAGVPSGRAWFCPKTGFSPPLPKDNTKIMSITWRATFGRYVS